MQQVGHGLTSSWRRPQAPPPALPLSNSVSPRGWAGAVAEPSASFRLDIAADQRSETAWVAPRVIRQSRGARRGRSVGLRAALAISAVLAGVGLALMMHRGRDGLPQSVAGRLPPAADIAQAVGLGLDQVAITGHRFTSDEAIFKALDLDRVRSLAAFDPRAAREKLEALPWVATVELTRLYPGQLDVRITEREAFALWRHSGREVLIDRSGRELQDVAAGSITHLPVIAGEDAPRATNALMVLLARYQPLAERFASAERVNGRRWSVRLKGGGRIELPADGEALALAELEAKGRLAELLGGAARIIDLRAPGRIAIRSAPAAGAGPQDAVAGIGALIERSTLREGGR